MAYAAQRIAEEESPLGMHEPEILLPQQFADRRRLGSSAVPEKRLMVATLEEAITTFQRHLGAKKPRGQRLFREAEEWIECEDADWIFSFESICSALDLDARSVREALAAWKEKQLHAPAVTPYRSPFRHSNGSRNSISRRSNESH